MEQIRTGNTRSLLNSHNKTARTTTLALIAPFFFITGVFASESPGTINNGIQETNMTQQKIRLSPVKLSIKTANRLSVPTSW